MNELYCDDPNCSRCKRQREYERARAEGDDIPWYALMVEEDP